ncbi:CobO: cob(I)yrinic acid a,c-diamide adenosyltransferase [Desulfosarcina variabilis str. Montpellier]|uniref:cob(I)yrinic acid a,c-diamide adenosyltransferase n=1 Tax=Desulfosarcina variabilis TaxID=2300 RepID=UPI003AFA5164
MSFKQGYIQVYTGDGKGKTTAAIGLAIRAAGAGLKVFIAQFIKSGDYSEIKALERYEDLITVKQYGYGRFFKGKPAAEDIAIAREGIAAIRQAFLSGDYQVVIMEEGNVAVTCGLFPVEEILSLMEEKPGQLELVITGRGANVQVIEKADLVTEMRAVKHYYQTGVAARTGIEK